MQNYTELFQNFVKNLVFTLLGLLCLLAGIIYGVLNTPVYIYRWIIVKLWAPRFYPAIGKAVTVAGQFMAAEFIPETNSNPSKYPAPRCAIVCNLYAPGIVSAEETAEVITNGWLIKKPGQSELQYPEFQQYIEKWMGFMFWKPDTEFSLLNHLHVHKIPEHATEEECESILCSLIETLVWKNFPVGRSPWEVHLVQNYRNSTMRPENQDDGGVMTVIMFRLHHAMIDGFSFLYAVIEGLGGQKLPSMQIAKPKTLEMSTTNCLAKVARGYVYTPWKIVRDMGYIVSRRYSYSGSGLTPFHCPDKQKKWKHYYDRTELVSVATIKFIKSRLNVSFTSVLLSLLAAGGAKHFKMRGFTGQKRFPVFCTVPLPGHPNKLRNHVVGTVVELNASSKLNSLERLRDTEEVFLEARHNSQLPILGWAYSRLMSSQLAPLAQYWCTNRFISAGLSNFPGPGLEVTFRGKTGVSLDFCTGGQQGVAGVTFGVVSYNGHVRIAATADRGTMEREELRQLMKSIEQEINVLYDHALATKDDVINSFSKMGDDFV